MATTPVEFDSPDGLTLTLELFALGSDTVANTGGDSATEKTNNKGRYSADVTEALSGWYMARVSSTGDDTIARYMVLMADTTGIAYCGDVSDANMDEIANHVWSNSTRTLTSSGGATAADVWSYATRTLTQTAAQIAAAVDGSDITTRRGDTLSASISGLGDISSRAAIWFAAKESERQSDAGAVALIKDSSLTTIQGSTPTAAQTGSISVTDSTAGDITITISADATASMKPLKDGVYDIQYSTTAGLVTTLSAGKFHVNPDVVRATS